MAKFIHILLGIIIIAVIISSCKHEDFKGRAKKMTDELFDKIAAGTANNDFSEQYFPKDQTIEILGNLRLKCDFANRKGVFINDYYSKDNISGDEISDIYEFHLKCGDIRIIATYKIIDQKLKLFGFNLESPRKDNSMILNSERRIYKE